MDRTKMLPFLVALLFVPAAWALPTPAAFDDAGSGADAGGDPSTAMALGYGRYHGNLSLGDSDWYAFPPGTGLGCAEASLLASHPMKVGFGQGASTAAGGLAEGAFATTLAIGSAPPLLGALPDEDPWGAVSVGPYHFELQVAPPAVVGDTNLQDAPSAIAAAGELPAECFSGHFRADGSDVDVYRFTAPPGYVATFTLAQLGGSGASAVILDGTGAPVGDPVVPGEVGQVALPQSGIYYLSAASLPGPASSAYALAMVVGPEPSGCRPYCLG